MTEFHIRSEELDAAAIMAAPPGSTDAKLLKMLGTQKPMTITAIEEPIVGKLLKGYAYPISCLHVIYDGIAYRVAVHYTTKIVINVIGIKDQFSKDKDFAIINMIAAVLEFLKIPKTAVSRDVVMWIAADAVYEHRHMVVDIAYLCNNRALFQQVTPSVQSANGLGVTAVPRTYLQEFGCLPSVNLPTTTLGNDF
jgi:hypothetical protein